MQATLTDIARLKKTKKKTKTKTRKKKTIAMKDEAWQLKTQQRKINEGNCFEMDEDQSRVKELQ